MKLSALWRVNRANLEATPELLSDVQSFSTTCVFHPWVQAGEQGEWSCVVNIRDMQTRHSVSFCLEEWSCSFYVSMRCFPDSLWSQSLFCCAQVTSCTAVLGLLCTDLACIYFICHGRFADHFLRASLLCDEDKFAFHVSLALRHYQCLMLGSIVGSA